MEKKVKFSDKSTVSKLVYSVIIAILCISAIVIGIVAANSRTKDQLTEPPADENQTPGADSGNADGGNQTMRKGEGSIEFLG